MPRALALLVLIAFSVVAKAENLVIEEVWNHARVIAYELPDSDGRADAIRYVESMRDRFKPKTEVLDAAANHGSLKNKLKDGFILYTTLGEKSELLRIASRKLGWEATGGSFRWRDVTTSTDGLRFILVGENPYSKGYCAIFAAVSNQALVGINDVVHGASSYNFFQGSQLLREGYYDKNFISKEYVSKAAALQDADQFFRTLKRVHPKLLGKVSEDGYRKLKEQTAAGITGKVDSNGEIAVEELASLLYYAAAYFKDGHTSVYWQTPLNEWNTRGRRFPAFQLLFNNGRFIIAAAKDRTTVGMEIVSVNGAPVLEFLRPVLDRCSGETLGFRASRFLGNEPFWYYLTNLFGADARYMLKLRDGEGRYREVPLETLSYAEYDAFRNQGGAEPFRPNHQGTQVEFFDSGANAHFMYSSFSLSTEEKNKVDRVFEEIKTKGARNLILDLRGNWGGESGMADYIFKYLYEGKFRTFRKVRVKASLDVLPHVPWWARPMILVLSGRMLSHSIPEHSTHKPGAFFPGHTYVLIDNGSFSMATAFAAMIRDYKAGTLLGYETGGLPKTFGGPHPFVLRNSRIPCAVAWTEITPPLPHPGDDEHGVIPDVAVSDQQLAAFQSEQDPVLAFTLRYIKTGPTPSAGRRLLP